MQVTSKFFYRKHQMTHFLRLFLMLQCKRTPEWRTSFLSTFIGMQGKSTETAILTAKKTTTTKKTTKKNKKKNNKKQQQKKQQQKKKQQKKNNNKKHQIKSQLKNKKIYVNSYSLETVLSDIDWSAHSNRQSESKNTEKGLTVTGTLISAARFL